MNRKIVSLILSIACLSHAASLEAISGKEARYKREIAGINRRGRTHSTAALQHRSNSLAKIIGKSDPEMLKRLKKHFRFSSEVDKLIAEAREGEVLVVNNQLPQEFDPFTEFSVPEKTAVATQLSEVFAARAAEQERLDKVARDAQFAIVAAAAEGKTLAAAPSEIIEQAVEHARLESTVKIAEGSEPIIALGSPANNTRTLHNRRAHIPVTRTEQKKVSQSFFQKHKKALGALAALAAGAAVTTAGVIISKRNAGK